jgi:hypothetical protein
LFERGKREEGSMANAGDRLEEAPEEIRDLAERCVAHVRNRLAFELDYSIETLSVLDHFVTSVLTDEGEGEPPPPAHPRRSSVMHLLAPTVGAYFGETLRRAFPCRWRFASGPPQRWALEFEEVFLRVNPAGVAAEAFLGAALEEWSGAIVTAPELAAVIRERLAAAPPIPEDEFYTFTARHEALQIVEDYLRERAARLGAVGCTSADYDRVLESN